MEVDMRAVNFILLFVVACFFPFSFVHAKTEAQTDFQKRLGALVEYQNSFKSYGELLTEMQSFGGLSREERAEIENVLKANGVSLESSMLKGELDGQTISWGRHRLTFLLDGSVKTRNGTVIADNKSEARDQLFKRILGALKNQNLSKLSPLDLFLPKANANSLKDVVSATTASIGKTFMTAVTSVNTPLCGAVAVPVDGLLWAIKKLVYEGTVSCTEYGEYVMNHYGEFWSQFAKNYNEPNKQLQKPLGYSKKVESAFHSVCYGPFARAMGERARMSAARLKQDKIDEAHLRIALSVGDETEIPRCTSGNAKLVEKYIKSETKKIDDLAKQSLVIARFGNDKSSAADQTQTIETAR